MTDSRCRIVKHKGEWWVDHDDTHWLRRYGPVPDLVTAHQLAREIIDVYYLSLRMACEGILRCDQTESPLLQPVL